MFRGVVEVVSLPEFSTSEYDKTREKWDRKEVPIHRSHGDKRIHVRVDLSAEDCDECLMRAKDAFGVISFVFSSISVKFYEY